MAAVSACGRKAALDTPYEAAVQARKDAEKAKQPLPPEPEKPVEDKQFILDPLIQVTGSSSDLGHLDHL